LYVLTKKGQRSYLGQATVMLSEVAVSAALSTARFLSGELLP